MSAAVIDRWTVNDDQALARAWLVGEPVDRIAGKLNRTIFAVRNRARALRLKRPVAWTPAMDRLLRDEWGQRGFCTRDIGRRIGKSPIAVRGRARSLGLRSAKWWSKEEMAVLRARYGKCDAIDIARELGRTRGQVHRQAAKHGLSRWPRLPKRLINRVKELYARGLPDRVTARKIGISYDRAKHIRKTHCADRGHPDIEAKRRGIDNQRKILGIKSGGELRKLGYRNYAIENGWPEDLRPREVQILNLLAARGVPMTKAEIAAAIGMPTERTFASGCRRTLLMSNGPGGSYTADLVNRGLLVRLVRHCHVRGQGKGRSQDFFTLSPAALAILQERATKETV